MKAMKKSHLLMLAFCAILTLSCSKDSLEDNTMQVNSTELKAKADSPTTVRINTEAFGVMKLTESGSLCV